MRRNKIKIFYTKTNNSLDQTQFKSLLKRLPPHIQKQISNFKRIENRQQALLGKLLLRYGLNDFGYSMDHLHNISYNKFGKPYIENLCDFNISHSDEFVVCAVSSSGKIGIDIEKIRETELNDFSSTMTPDQWNMINNSTNPTQNFFNLWSIKESVIKAEGQGLSIPLQELVLKENFVEYGDSILHLNKIHIHNEYCCSLASESPENEIIVEKVNFH